MEMRNKRRFMQNGGNEWTSEVSTWDPDVKGTISGKARFGTKAEEKKYLVEDPQREAMNRFKTGAGLVKEVAGFTPAGDTIDAIDFYNAAIEGDGVGMALSGIGFIPFIGNYLKNYSKTKRFKKLSKALDGEIDMVSGTKMTKDKKYPWYDKKSERNKLDFYKEEMGRELRRRREYNMLYDDGALGEGRLIHQRRYMNNDVLEPAKRSRNNNEAYKNKGIVENAVWWRKEYPFYDFDDKMDIVSISEEGIPYKHVENHFDRYTVTTGPVPINSAKDVKIYNRAPNGEIIPKEHMRKLQHGGSDWTSEISSFDPDVQKTITTPVPEEEQRRRFIEDPQRKSMDRFKKGIEYIWTASRYLPGIYGAIPNAVEFAKAVDERDLGGMMSNSTAFLPFVGWLRKMKALNDAKKYANAPGIKLLKWKNMDDLANEFGKDKAEKIISYGNWADNAANVTMNAIEDLTKNKNEITTLEWLDRKLDRRPKVGDIEKKQFGGRIGIKKKRFDNSEKRLMDLLGEVSSR